MDVNGDASTFFSVAWRANYAHIVSTFMREAASSGAHVLWLGAPVMHQAGYSAGVAQLNSLYAKEARSAAHVVFAPTWNVLSSRAGLFEFSTTVNGHNALVRTSDGIHPTYVGDQVLATYAISQLRRDFSVQLRAQEPMVVARAAK